MHSLTDRLDPVRRLNGSSVPVAQETTAHLAHVLALIDTLPPADVAVVVPAVLGALEDLRVSLWLALVMSGLQSAELHRRKEVDAAAPDGGTVDGADVVNAAEAARLLGMSTTWLYRNARSLPFTRRLGPRALRFSVTGIRKYLTGHRPG